MTTDNKNSSQFIDILFQEVLMMIRSCLELKDLGLENEEIVERLENHAKENTFLRLRKQFKIVRTDE